MKYGIKIYSTGRYIVWCDECWYETTDNKHLALDSKEEAMAIAQQMRKHYTYKTVIVDSDVNEEVVDFLKKTTNPMKEESFFEEF